MTVMSSMFYGAEGSYEGEGGAMGSRSANGGKGCKGAKGAKGAKNAKNAKNAKRTDGADGAEGADGAKGASNKGGGLAWELSQLAIPLGLVAATKGLEYVTGRDGSKKKESSPLMNFFRPDKKRRQKGGSEGESDESGGDENTGDNVENKEDDSNQEQEEREEAKTAQPTKTMGEFKIAFDKVIADGNTCVMGLVEGEEKETFKKFMTTISEARLTLNPKPEIIHTGGSTLSARHALVAQEFQKMATEISNFLNNRARNDAHIAKSPSPSKTKKSAASKTSTTSAAKKKVAAKKTAADKKKTADKKKKVAKKSPK